MALITVTIAISPEDKLDLEGLGHRIGVPVVVAGCSVTVNSSDFFFVSVVLGMLKGRQYRIKSAMPVVREPT
ncbi:hypothetical protein A2716_05210 [candidate division WWE3 bacterium RIFCSPHIGHO2_01_FULL_40_23]|uniref:Uncharacterized protein n=1 Tax=candidate division WWE3 bacterium RIFCSPLOWO2_01_FULL_41_18 TaxID=1802625 RepID=A0A1F4VDN0_UNCKA|nr:MAG: hypothetical protein A2716_05210 [candidate division WWE3 bacterium RIFCSPHIGHO2_01_FULL_40_23]OGC55269.1 MAG: hypothetical protein A3A78_04820 [candidate division WWE3 bacterium RIFCSPLOWO2_01_FULL_41_18]